MPPDNDIQSRDRVCMMASHIECHAYLFSLRNEHGEASIQGSSDAASRFVAHWHLKSLLQNLLSLIQPSVTFHS